MSDYYPEFYLRKRQREQAYRRATIAIVGVVVLFVAGAICAYLINNFIGVKRVQPGASPELAQQQQQLETDQKMASANIPDVLPDEAEPREVDLKQIAYSESFPTVSIGIEGVGPSPGIPGETDPAALLGEGNEEESVESTPEEEPESEAADENETGARDPRVDKVTPQQDTDEPAKPQTEKPAARATDPPKKSDKPKAETKREEPKPKPEQKPEALKETEQAAKSAAKPAEPSYSYTVYASAYLNREEAEEARKSLGALGLSGTVIDAKTGDYLLKVATVDALDQASALENKLTSSGFGGAFVTRKAER